MSPEKNTHFGISMGILRVNRTGGDLKCKGHETRKRWKKRVSQVRGTKRQEKWSDKGKLCERRGYFKRWLSGR